MGEAFTLCCLGDQIYTTGAEGEAISAKISTPELDAKVNRSARQRFRPRRGIPGQLEADKLIWAEGFSLPLTFRTPGNVAVRSTLANFGAAGWATGLHRDRFHEAPGPPR